MGWCRVEARLERDTRWSGSPGSSRTAQPNCSTRRGASGWMRTGRDTPSTSASTCSGRWSMRSRRSSSAVGRRIEHTTRARRALGASPGDWRAHQRNAKPPAAREAEPVRRRLALRDPGRREPGSDLAGEPDDGRGRPEPRAATRSAADQADTAGARGPGRRRGDVGRSGAMTKRRASGVDEGPRSPRSTRPGSAASSSGSTTASSRRTGRSLTTSRFGPGRRRPTTAAGARRTYRRGWGSGVRGRQATVDGGAPPASSWPPVRDVLTEGFVDLRW